jgi:hypothetical protein
MTRALLPLLAATLLTACAAGHHSRGSSFVDYRPHVPRSSVTPLATRRERRAGREAETLLRRLAVPAGAVRFDHLPLGNDDLNHSDLGVSVVTMTADRYSFWRVPGSGKAVIAFEKRQMLPGLHGVGAGSSPGGYASEEFYGRLVNGSALREVSVSVVPIGGQTYLRLDAGVAWIYPRSPGEVVPADVREIGIHGGGISERVDKPAKVRRIVRWFDALNVAQPGPAVLCMAVLNSAYVRFAFRAASGAVLASALVPSGPANGCDSIAFTVRGKQQKPLIDARSDKYAFVNRVQRLLGIRFSKPRR